MDADFKNKIADEIAHTYYDLDDGTLQIYRLRSISKEEDPDEPVKLLEVNLDANPTGTILPVQFLTSEGFSYITSEITVAEFQKLKNKEMSLPNDWFLAEPIAREENWDPTAKAEFTEIVTQEMWEEMNRS